MADHESPVDARLLKIAERIVRAASGWRSCEIPVRGWPRWLRDAERLAQAYLKEHS